MAGLLAVFQAFMISLQQWDLSKPVHKQKVQELIPSKMFMKPHVTMCPAWTLSMKAQVFHLICDNKHQNYFMQMSKKKHFQFFQIKFKFSIRPIILSLCLDNHVYVG